MAVNSVAECRRYIDLWAMPGVHPSNIEFLQRLKSADTNHFTKGMDVIGTISDQDPESKKWEKTHLIGIRTDVWKPCKKEMSSCLKAVQRRRKTELKKQIKRHGRLSDKQSDQLNSRVDTDDVMTMQIDDIEKRRLVLKLFKTTGKRARWCGTLEEVTVTEIHNSMGSKRMLLTFVVMLPGMQMVTYVQQNHRTARYPAVFTLGYYDGDRMWHVTLQQRWFSFGPDFDVFIDGKRVGLLDAKLLSFGADSYLDIENHPLADDTQFADLLTLFSTSVSYHKAIRRSIRKRLKAVKSGQSHRHVIEDEELRLRHNGRAAA